MQNYKNNQLVNDGNAIMDISVLSVIGDREDQQDSFGYSLKNNEGLVVVCDGMGGHEGGKIASCLSTEKFISDYDSSYPSENITLQLIESAKKSDGRIHALKNKDGEPLNAGSTCVAIVIREDKLFWCSVGDSRAYLLRGEEFVQLTKDQNYGTVLNEKLHAGVIGEEEYQQEEKRAEALISYIGIGNLSLIDYNNSPLSLNSGDKIIIMSDGLYKVVRDDEIQRVIENFRNCSEALQALEMKAKKAARIDGISRDNMTVAIISIK